MYVADASPPTLLRALRDAKVGPGHGVMILLAEQGAPDLSRLVDVLSELEVPFFGGVFPGLIDGAHLRHRGAVLCAMPLLGEPVLVERLDAPLPDLMGMLPESARVGGPRPTALMFADGLSTHSAAWMRAVYAQLGTAVTYLGGGAGSRSFEPTICLFTRAGVCASGGVLALTSLSSTVGVQHGWERMAGPLLATRTTFNRVHELNWRPAAEVYGEAIGREVHQEGFFEVAKAHPFGLRKEGQEDVVRDPLSVDDEGSLVCGGEVPQNAVVYILQGKPASLVDAARAAATEAMASQPEPHITLVIDCVSRSLFLGEPWADELAAICEPLTSSPVPLGALTLGEIASRGDSLVEWFNKTVVVGVLCADD